MTDSIFIVEMTESVGIRYSATFKMWSDANSRDEAIDQWSECQRQIGGVQDGDREFMFDSQGYRSELETVYEVSGDRADILRDELQQLSLHQ